MDQYTLLDIVGKAFANGESDALSPLLAEDCDYTSEYANKKINGAVNIISKMKSVDENIDDTCRYSYKIIELESVMSKGLSLKDLDSRTNMYPCHLGLLLYQYSTESPVAVVVCMIDLYEKIKSIYLYRDKSKFNIDFYGEEIDNDSPEDLPSTVKPYPRRFANQDELRSFLSQKEPPKEENSNIYIWRKADEFVKKWLPKQGYHVLESSIFEDCIGYRCDRRGFAYTIFVYAYGKEKTTQLDGEYCNKLANLSFATNSIILILYLNVDRYMDGDTVKYRVRNYCGSDNVPELWQLSYANERPILEYFPRKEMKDQVWQLMYAFNREDLDVYDCIITDKKPAFTEEGSNGRRLNSSFYHALQKIHREYGNMKLGYVRYNDVIYSSIPYIENYGFFGFRTDSVTDRIIEVNCYHFEGGKRKILEFIKTEKREPDNLFSYIPKLTKAIPLPPAPTERFAALLFFDNGECKKFVLPIYCRNEDKEVVTYRNHVFSNGIWNSISVVDRHDIEHESYSQRSYAITFKNGFYISGMRCYLESTPYSEPEPLDEIVYEDDNQMIRKLWKWKVRSLHEDKETGVLLVQLEINTYDGTKVFCSVDGKRMTSVAFSYLNNFSEGLALAGILGKGCGYIDKDGNIVIPLKYSDAYDFNFGMAMVELDGRRLLIDKSEKVYCELSDKYKTTQYFSEGMLGVSTLDISHYDLAYHSDYEDIAGIWGFVDETGHEVIAPQYIYAHDFRNGIAIVAKGKWTIDPKWDNEHNQGRYWTEYELWGGIDKNGNEVIPFIFDEIKFINDCNDMYMAHIGGWKDGHWGVIDQSGKWIAEPIFEAFGYEYCKGLISFYSEDKGRDDDLIGIYDLNQQKVLFEPQFLDVDFYNDGRIKVEVYDEKLGRSVEKIIDRNGNEAFQSEYTHIFSRSDRYEVSIRGNDGSNRHGLVDLQGNIILPCIYEDVPWNGIIPERELIIFKKDGKQGVVDYDNNIVVPAKYFEIHDGNDPFLTVRVGEKDHYKEGMISFDGTEIIPAKYERISWCRDRKHFFGCSNGCYEMYLLEEK